MDSSFYFLPQYHLATVRDGRQVWVPRCDPALECVRAERESIEHAGGAVDCAPWLQRDFLAQQYRRWRWAAVVLFVLVSTVAGWLLRGIPELAPWLTEHFLMQEMAGMFITGTCLALFLQLSSESEPQATPALL